MPKTKLTKKFCEPKANLLAATLQAYKKANGVTDDYICEQLNVSRQTVNLRINQPAGAWRIKLLATYCDIIGCPLEEALASAAKSI